MSFIRAARQNTSAGLRAFSTSRINPDVSKVTLVGRIAGDPIKKTTKNDKEFLIYRVATTDPLPPPSEGDEPTTSFHTIFAYGPQVERLASIQKGALVYVEGTLTVKQKEAEDGTYLTEYFIHHNKLNRLRKPYSPAE